MENIKLVDIRRIVDGEPHAAEVYNRPTDDLAEMTFNTFHETHNVITNTIAELKTVQTQGYDDWKPNYRPYKKNAEVRHAGKNWRSNVDNNTTTPAAGSSWTCDADRITSNTEAAATALSTANAAAKTAEWAGLSNVPETATRWPNYSEISGTPEPVDPYDPENPSSGGALPETATRCPNTQK